MTPPREAADELRAIAGDRPDILADVAGTVLGAVLAQPGWSRPEALLAVSYLMLAGADRKVTIVNAQEATLRIASPTHATLNRPTHRG